MLRQDLGTQGLPRFALRAAQEENLKRWKQKTCFHSSIFACLLCLLRILYHKIIGEGIEERNISGKRKGAVVW